MDWIETLLEVSPDGGSGATEMLCAVALASITLVVAGYLRRPSNRPNRNRQGLKGEIEA